MPIDAVLFARKYTRWTYAVKRWLAQSAEEKDCYAIFTESGKSNEFVLDLVWWKQGRPSNALLACDSEWGNSRHPEGNPARVAEDFDKLLSTTPSRALPPSLSTAAIPTPTPTRSRSTFPSVRERLRRP
jgi:hypothetical protein